MTPKRGVPRGYGGAGSPPVSGGAGGVVPPANRAGRWRAPALRTIGSSLGPLTAVFRAAVSGPAGLSGL